MTPVAKLTPLQQRIMTVLCSASAAMTCEEIAVAVGDDATEKGVALTMSGLLRRGLVRWSWVQRGGARARKGYSLKPAVDGAA